VNPAENKTALIAAEPDARSPARPPIPPDHVANRLSGAARYPRTSQCSSHGRAMPLLIKNKNIRAAIERDDEQQ
jgi:hypothetical protein